MSTKSHVLPCLQLRTFQHTVHALPAQRKNWGWKIYCSDVNVTQEHAISFTMEYSAREVVDAEDNISSGSCCSRSFVASSLGR